MRERHLTGHRRRTREFETFVAGAGGRLLHAATLLTAEPADLNPRALRLLTAALAETYARWHRLRGEDPYDRTRQELAARFARTAWRHHRPTVPGVPRPPLGEGLLARLTPQERLILVLRLYEGVAEEQTAAMVGLPVDRVRAICTRAIAAMRSTPTTPPTTPPTPTARDGGTNGPAHGPAKRPANGRDGRERGTQERESRGGPAVR
ncbi:sigma factor-like helix-turn-helix DNA-binding protein [Streptomyces sp. NPDC048416]|uniref:sigma factor-like helix-turn-helix DNA-binding protein n=1 Tax=Streptomyces sp. NPDC048416 TaxID=3365546 RepID=UPI003713646C